MIQRRKNLWCKIIINILQNTALTILGIAISMVGATLTNNSNYFLFKFGGVIVIQYGCFVSLCGLDMLINK